VLISTEKQDNFVVSQALTLDTASGGARGVPVGTRPQYWVVNKTRPVRAFLSRRSKARSFTFNHALVRMRFALRLNGMRFSAQRGPGLLNVGQGRL
jgi:hypothetical protein